MSLPFIVRPLIVALVCAAILGVILYFVPAAAGISDVSKLIIQISVPILSAGGTAYNQRKVAGESRRSIEATAKETGATFDSFPDTPPLYGRQKDFERLKRLLATGKLPVIQLIGKSGVGKTALAAAVVRKMHRAYVRVEMGADATADGVASRLFEIFHNEKPPQRPLVEIVASIIEAWQKNGCLLVLDNIHCLLTPDAKPKDDNAELLLKRLGEHGQLLTLGWPGTDALGLGAEHVVKWELHGLSEKPGVEKLRAEKVEGTPKSITLEKVVDRLDGNPKMLEIVGELIRKHGGQAAVLDQNLDWIASSMAPLRAVWQAIGPELQELVAVLCVFRRGRNAARLGTFLGRANVQQQLESLISWGLTKPLDGVEDYAPDHDLVRKMVREHFGEEKFLEMHGQAAKLWLEEGKDIGKEKTPTTIEEIQPLLEASYYMMQRKDGDTVTALLMSKWGGHTLDDLADWFGAWADLIELWRAVSLHAEAEINRGNARHMLGLYMQKRGDWEKALAEYRASLEISEKLGDVAGIAKSRHQIGMVYQYQGDWENALAEYRASLEIAEKIGDKADVANNHGQIGNVYQIQGDLDKAVVEYRVSLEIAEKRGDMAGVAKCRHNIGIVYQNKGDWEKALAEYRASLEISEKRGEVADVAKSRHQIGAVYQLQGDWEKALAEYRASLEIKEKLGDKQGVATTHGQMGLLFIQMNEYTEALPHTLMALSIFAQIGDPRAKQASGDLVRLRRGWSAKHFDKAWKEQTGEEVPDWLKEDSKEKSE